VVKDPSLLEKIPHGSTLEFVEKDFAKLEKTGRRKTRTKTKYLRVNSNLDII